MTNKQRVEKKTFSVPSSSSWAEDGYLLRRTITGSGRNAVTTWEKRVSREVDVEGAPDDVIARIKEAADGVVDANLENETYGYAYDSNEYRHTVVNGWVAQVSEEEIAKAVAAQEEADAKRAAQERTYAERQLAAIRAAHPDLLA